MALSDRVTARVPNSVLVRLTNPGAPAGAAATSVDTTLLANAASDAEASFLQECGVAYDDTNAAHYYPAVLAVLWHLKSYSDLDAPTVEKAEQKFRDAARRYALAGGGRDRLLPKSTSTLVPSEPPTGVDIRPDSDRSRWEDLTTFLPGGGSVQDRRGVRD